MKRTRQSAPESHSWTIAVNLKNSQQKQLKIEQIILIYSLFLIVTSIIKIVATLFFEIIILPSFFCRHDSDEDWNYLYDDTVAFR